jgi:hypothetical protein
VKERLSDICLLTFNHVDTSLRKRTEHNIHSLLHAYVFFSKFRRAFALTGKRVKSYSRHLGCTHREEARTSKKSHHRTILEDRRGTK